MKKLFTNRARVVVYAEAEDVARMERHARALGFTLPEWARKTLLDQIFWEVQKIEKDRNSETQEDTRV